MSRMVLGKISFLICMCLVVFLCSTAGLAAERIQDFKSAIQINRDATITITETITVRAEGVNIKRGIYRDLPLLQTNAYGTEYAVTVDVQAVRRNGHPEPHFTEIGTQYLRLYIGKKDVFIESGVHVYEITYVVGQQIAFLQQYDELAWNVTGNEWSFPIDLAQAEVKLPSGIAPIQQYAYTGRQGEAGGGYTVSSNRQGNIVFTSQRQLAKGEGLTIAVAWPKGIVEKPDYLPQHEPPKERILNYDSHVLVMEDGRLNVTETIRVICSEEGIFGGLWRHFTKFRESSYTGKSGRSVKRIIKVVKTGMDGDPIPFKITQSSYTLYVHWGPQTRYIEPGVHQFTLSYTVDRQIDRQSEGEFLYWEALGYGWSFPVEKAQVTLEFPSGVRIIKSADGKGKAASREGKQIIDRLSTEKIQIRSTSILTPGKSLVARLVWPPATFAEPSLFRRLHYSILDFIYTYLGGIFLLVTSIYYLLVWHRRGRDPKKGTIFPLFKPPENLSPAAVRFIDQRGEDNTLLSISILNMAVNGWLRIKEEEEEEYILERLDGPKNQLAQEEEAAFAQLFKSENTLEMQSKNYRRFKAARTALNKYLKKNYGGADYFSNNYLWIFLGAILSLIPQGLVTMDASRLEFGIFLAVALTLCSGAASIIGYFTIQAWSQLLSGHARLFGVLVLTFLLALPIMGLEFVLIKTFAGLMPLAGLIIFLLSPILVAVFFQLLRAYTVKGRKIMDGIKGFGLYLKTAEGSRLQSIHPPEKTPQLFEKYLPYAQALELEQAWCDQFASVLRTASEAPGGGYATGWYQGTVWHPEKSTFFMDNFSSQFRSSLSSASSAPRSRSWSGGRGSRFSGGGFSSGGGSSGGGGGGGGGGGW